MNDYSRPPRRASYVLVLLGGFAAVVFLVFLTVLTAGFIGQLVAFGAALAAIATFHYVVWGRLLTEHVARERQEERLLERARDEPRDDGRITNRPSR